MAVIMEEEDSIIGEGEKGGRRAGSEGGRRPAVLNLFALPPSSLRLIFNIFYLLFSIRMP